jgi:tetratricopeptide (TPR) repeat protein
VDYARFLVAQKRPVDALQCLNELVQRNAQHARAWRLGGEIALSQPEYLEFARDWTAEAARQLPDDLAVTAQRAEALLLSQSPAEARPLWERACNGARPPRAVAAAILCATLEARPGLTIRDAGEESSVSQAFLDWYRRLVAFQAVDAVVQLNDRVGLLRETLPGAARVIESVTAAANQD